MDQGEFPSEEVFIRALRAGEPKAYEKLYRAAFPSILSFVYLNTGQEDDAQDLLQEAIIILFRKLQQPGFNISCKVTTYVYSVCRHKWLNELRKARTPKDPIDLDDYVHIPDQDTEEEKSLLDKRLKEAFVQLDKHCQQILIRYYFYEHSLDEIAQAINLPNGNTVKVKKFRCMQKLKDVFKQ